jgi:hypothetical protein
VPGVTSVAVTMTANARPRQAAGAAAEGQAWCCPGSATHLAVASGKGGGQEHDRGELAIELRETGAKSD